jgi:hypothetical protein
MQTKIKIISIKKSVAFLLVMVFFLGVFIYRPMHDVSADRNVCPHFYAGIAEFKTILFFQKSCMEGCSCNDNSDKIKFCKNSAVLKRALKLKIFSRLINQFHYNYPLIFYSQNRLFLSTDIFLISNLPVYLKTLSIRC